MYGISSVSSADFDWICALYLDLNPGEDESYNSIDVTVLMVM